LELAQYDRHGADSADHGRRAENNFNPAPTGFTLTRFAPG
jgi:hypothetical protein